MSASAEIFRFPGRSGGGSSSGAWTSQDIADIYRCLDQFARQGLVVEASSGMSDEGDPWFAIEDVSSGDALIHIARIDGFIVVHVLDGDSWSGDTLRDALAQIDMGSLLSLAGIADAHGDTHAGSNGGDDDKDGTHAFLRIVSAVVAVLTADVIANAVTHEAAASPLPPAEAVSAGDHVVDANSAALDLPAVADSAPAAHKDSHQAAPADPASATDSQMHVTIVATKDTDAAVTAPAPAASAEPVAIAVIHPDDVLPTGPQPQAAPALLNLSADAPLSFMMGTEHVQVAFNDNVSFSGTEKKSDTFLVVLDKESQSLTVKLGEFEVGRDNLVIEKSDGDSTSSAIITDLGALVANGGANLTIIGQSAVEIHLSGAGGTLVTGG